MAIPTMPSSIRTFLGESIEQSLKIEGITFPDHFDFYYSVPAHLTNKRHCRKNKMEKMSMLNMIIVFLKSGYVSDRGFQYPASDLSPDSNFMQITDGMIRHGGRRNS